MAVTITSISTICFEEGAAFIRTTVLPQSPELHHCPCSAILQLCHQDHHHHHHHEHRHQHHDHGYCCHFVSCLRMKTIIAKLFLSITTVNHNSVILFVCSSSPLPYTHTIYPAMQSCRSRICVLLCSRRRFCYCYGFSVGIDLACVGA